MNNIIELLTKEEKTKVVIQKYKKNSLLFEEDEICTSIGVVLSGEVEITSYSFVGKEIVFNKIEPFGIFGNNLIFSSDPKYRGNVIATSDCVIALINKENLLYLLQHNRSFLEEYLKMHADFSKTLNSKIKLLSFNKAEERLDYYLYINYGKVKYKSITSLARELSLTREATSRLISTLSSEHKIEIKNHIIFKIR